MKSNDYMETLAKRLFVLTLLALIVLLVLVTFSSCGSRKKNRQSKVYLEQVATRQIGSLIQKSNKESVEITNAIATRNTQSALGKFSGTVANPLLPATVAEEEKDGKTIRTYHNFLTVNTQDETKSETQRDSLSAIITRRDSTITQLQNELESLKETKLQEEQKQLHTRRGFPWWILIVVALIYGIISYFKGLNPLKWLPKRPSV